MKTIKFFPIAVATVLLAACSSGEPANNGGMTDGYDNYIVVQISAKNGDVTRAGDEGFANGTESESTVKNALFGFYNAQGQLVGQQILDIADNEKSTQTDGGNVETIINKKVPVNFNSSFDGKVLCFLNVEDNAQAPATLDDETSKYSLEVVTKDKSFVMTNSTYYKGDVMTFASDIAGVYEEGTTENIQPTVIYVERVAAKVGVTQAADAKITDVNLGEYATDKNGGTVSLTFRLDGWCLTATAQESYKIKRFWDNSGNALSLTDANNLLAAGFQSKWNQESLFRSYWATSLNYYEDGEVNHYGEVGNQAGLNYASWNDAKSAVGTSLYTLEQNNADGSKKTLYTGVLVTGTMTLNGAAGQDLYTYGYDAKSQKSVIYTEDQLWETLMRQLIVKKEGNTPSAAEAKVMFSLVNDTQKSGVVNLTLNDGANLADWTISGSALNATALESGLASLNTINKYKDGKCYYWVPINHFGIDGTQVVNGSYGVIRNHSYNIELQGIGGLALPVNDPEKPLIPEDPESFYFMQANINVLAWHVMPTQGVILK